jgi:transcriptional regulator with XRE-family HTH domain
LRKGRQAAVATFGEKIKELRKKAGLTLDQLAEMTGSSKSYVWEVENKNPPRPSAEKIDRIAKALGVTADYLMDAKADLVTAEDEAFFRKYKSLDPDVKDQIRRITETFRK